MVVINPSKASFREAASELKNVLDQHKVKTIWLETGKANTTKEIHPLPLKGKKIDMVIAGGGDGTLLQTAQRMMHAQIPLLGVNLGSLGFLASIPRDAIPIVLPEILNGKYRISERMTLEYNVWRGRQRLGTGWALNDVVVARGHHSHMIRLVLRVSDQLVTEYHCDGLIVSTPTGSTAYSLAAGGPIISPKVAAFSITPICAHTLSNRPLIVDATEQLELDVPVGTPSIALHIDGLDSIHLKPNDRIIFKKAKKIVPLVQLPEEPFYTIVREKLKWSGKTTDFKV